MVELSVVDNLGFPISDDTVVRLQPSGESVTTKAGQARFYLNNEVAGETIDFEVAGKTSSYKVQYGSGSSARGVYCIDEITHKGVSGVKGLVEGHVVVGTEEGWLFVPTNACDLKIIAPGYEELYAQKTTQLDPIALKPLFSGVLLNKKIAIDPGFFVARDKSAIPYCSSETILAHMTSEYLAAELRRAGAEVLVTSEDRFSGDPLERLAKIESFSPDFLLCVAYKMPPDQAKVITNEGYRRDDLSHFVGYYPNSTKGRALAGLVASQFAGMTSVPSVTYLIQQSSCVAVLIHPHEERGGIADDFGTNITISSDHAAKILSGVVAYYGNR